MKILSYQDTFDILQMSTYLYLFGWVRARLSDVQN